MEVLFVLFCAAVLGLAWKNITAPVRVVARPFRRLGYHLTFIARLRRSRMETAILANPRGDLSGV